MKYQFGALVELYGKEKADVLEKTPPNATLPTTNPTRTHQLVPSVNIYYELQMKNTVTLLAEHGRLFNQ
jgi:hypothetical protein